MCLAVHVDLSWSLPIDSDISFGIVKLTVMPHVATNPMLIQLMLIVPYKILHEIPHTQNNYRQTKFI